VAPCDTLTTTELPIEENNNSNVTAVAADEIKNFLTTTGGLTFTRSIAQGIARYGWTLGELRAKWKSVTGATPAGTMRLRIMAAAIADGSKVVRRDTSDPCDLNPMTGEPWTLAKLTPEIREMIDHPEGSMALSSLVEIFKSLPPETQNEMRRYSGLTVYYDPASDDKTTRAMFKAFANLRAQIKAATAPTAPAGPAAAQGRKVQFLANLDAQKSEGTQP
jgi:hypothetical protein